MTAKIDVVFYEQWKNAGVQTATKDVNACGLSGELQEKFSCHIANLGEELNNLMDVDLSNNVAVCSELQLVDQAVSQIQQDVEVFKRESPEQSHQLESMSRATLDLHNHIAADLQRLSEETPITVSNRDAKTERSLTPEQRENIAIGKRRLRNGLITLAVGGALVGGFLLLHLLVTPVLGLLLVGSVVALVGGVLAAWGGAQWALNLAIKD